MKQPSPSVSVLFSSVEIGHLPRLEIPTCVSPGAAIVRGAERMLKRVAGERSAGSIPAASTFLGAQPNLAVESSLRRALA
jgi:hypothetical protein